MKIILIFLSMVMMESAVYSAESILCSDILEQLNHENSPTENLWAYINESVDLGNVSEKQLTNFYNEIRNGKLINPANHQQTKLGPVFSSAADLVTYKTIQAFLDDADLMDLEKLIKMVEREIQSRQVMKEKKSVAMKKTDLDFAKLFVYESFVVHLKHNALNYDKFYREIILSDPRNFLELAVELLADKNFVPAAKILLYLDQLDQYLGEFPHTDVFLHGISEMLEVHLQKNPLPLLRKMLNFCTNEDVKNIFLERLDKKYPGQEITDFFKEVYQSSNDRVGQFAYIVYLSRSEVVDFDEVRENLKRKDVSYQMELFEALSKRKDEETYQFFLSLVNPVSVEDDMIASMLVHNNEVVGNNYFEMIKQLIHYKEPEPFFPTANIRNNAKKALSKQTHPESLELIKNILKNQNPDTDADVFMLIGRQDEGIFDLAWPYLKSKNLRIVYDAVSVIAQLNDPKFDEAVISYLVKINEFGPLISFKDRDAKYLKSLLKYYDEKKPNLNFFTMIEGKNDLSLVDFIKAGIFSKNSAVEEKALACLKAYPAEVAVPILQSYLAEGKVSFKKTALEMLYGSVEPKSLNIFKKYLKAKDNDIQFAAFKGFVHAVFLAKVEELQTFENYRLIRSSVRAKQ